MSVQQGPLELSELAGTVCVVTGAGNNGIGYGIAEEAAKKGMDIVLMDLHKSGTRCSVQVAASAASSCPMRALEQRRNISGRTPPLRCMLKLYFWCGATRTRTTIWCGSPHPPYGPLDTTYSSENCRSETSKGVPVCESAECGSGRHERV